jgi:hypothetical protein
MALEVNNIEMLNKAELFFITEVSLTQPLKLREKHLQEK